MSRLVDYLEIDEYLEFIVEYNKCLNPTYNPRAINISILFNGVLTCFFCKYWHICTGIICHDEILEGEIYDEWNLWRGLD